MFHFVILVKEIILKKLFVKIKNVIYYIKEFNKRII